MKGSGFHPAGTSPGLRIGGRRREFSPAKQLQALRLRLQRSAPLTLRFDGSYSKRVPVAVEQPVLYTSPFKR